MKLPFCLLHCIFQMLVEPSISRLMKFVQKDFINQHAGKQKNCGDGNESDSSLVLQSTTATTH
jgi:hypothetical protein